MDDALSEVLDGDAPEPEGGAVVKIGPFGGLTSQEAGRRSVEARRNKAIEKARNEELRREGAQLKIKNAPPREDLRMMAAAVLFEVGEKILNEEIEIRSPREAASVAEVFFNILRLESGQSTANVEHLSAEDRMAKLEEYREVAKARQAAAIDAQAT